MTREELENKMAVLLGGRAAEWIVYGYLSTGAADDLAKVTDIARAIVTRYGMTEKLGHVALEKDRRSFLATDQPYYAGQERAYSDETATAIDEEVRRIIDDMFNKAVGLLRERRKSWSVPRALYWTRRPSTVRKSRRSLMRTRSALNAA